MLVKELCTGDVVCCGPRSTVLEAARLMRHKHVGDVVIVDDPDWQRVPLGVVTDQTTEHHDGTTVGDRDPVGGPLHVEGLGGERDPVVGSGFGEAHGGPS